MRSKLLFLSFVCLWNSVHSQTFTGGSGAIPDSGFSMVCFPVSVNAVGIINGSFGLSSVCINITHHWDSDLEIYLKSPDGTTVPLSIQNGGSGDNYTGTCFSASATHPLEDSLAPFTGSFIPDGNMGAVNNGQNANGIWSLCIIDIAAGYTGNLINWNLSFSTDVPRTPPSCNGNMPPGNTCADATPICSFNGFCSRTSSSYTADSWPELDTTFCGTVQNNAFLKFVAAGSFMNFSIWVTTSTDHNGIQMFFYDGGCGSGAITEYGCYSPIRPGASPTIISATGLTPGNIYYLMIDGFAGDQCDYIIEPFPLENALSVSPRSADVCLGNPIQLNATGGNGIYAWTGEGLSSTFGNSVTATPSIATTYSVSSVDPGGMCPVSKQVTVGVLPLPERPVLIEAPDYCQKEIASPLIATGSNVLWYMAANGGVGSTHPIVPATVNPGTHTYFVTQTIGCESPRAAINVTIKAAPELGAMIYDTICTGKHSDITADFELQNLTASWSFNGEDIAPPHQIMSAGFYSVKVENSDGCRDTGTINVSVMPLLKVFAGNDTIAALGVAQQLHCSSAATYSWSPAAPLNFSDIQNPVAVLQHDQEFIVRATDRAGCIGLDTIMIKVYKGPNYYVPNAFTPNGDGLNDFFHITPVGIRNTDYCRIINRYGKTIFQTADLSNSWDGTYMNVKQPGGTYVWLIRGLDKNGKILELKGTVILIR